jgi:creatinine amidohydrolase
MTTLRWADTPRERLTAVLPDALVVLPVGATEQHGPYLPTGTDALLAGTVAERAAMRAGSRAGVVLVLAPTMPIGASDHHFPFGGTLSFRPETMLAVLADLARSVAECGGRRLVLVNGHGGNRGVLHAAAAAASSRYDLAVAHLDYWVPAGEPGGTPVPGHAGEFETAMVLAVRPDLVKPRRPRKDVPVQPVLSDVDVHTARAWREIDGFTDDPARATPERGAAWLERCVAELADRLDELAKTI